MEPVVVTTLITTEPSVEVTVWPLNCRAMKSLKWSGVDASCVETECSVSNFTLPRSRSLTDESYQKGKYFNFKRRTIIPFSWQVFHKQAIILRDFKFSRRQAWRGLCFGMLHRAVLQNFTDVSYYIAQNPRRQSSSYHNLFITNYFAQPQSL
jgi:hypothetical protein